MKKSLLTLFCLTMLGSAAMAAPMSLQKGRVAANHLKAVNSSQSFINGKEATKALTRKAPTRASDLWMNWGYCYDPYTALSFPQGELGGAIMITKAIATQYAGAEITAVQVPNPTGQNYINPLAGNEFSIWVAESLDGERICTGKGIFGEEGFEYTSANLDTPYTLKANTPIYVGFDFELPNPNNYPYGLFSLVVDAMQPVNSHTAYLYSTYTGLDSQGYMTFGDTYEWKSIGNDFGSICMTVTLSGDMLPTNQLEMPDYLIPAVVKPNTDFNFVFIAVNYGANQFDDIDITMDIEGQEPQVKHVELNRAPIAYGEWSQDTVSYVCKPTGNLPYKLYVSAINGEPVNISIAEDNLLSIEKGFDRNVVIEEATGTWCGWCVVGYAGMEYMKENYAGKGFIGIAMHQDDPMAVLDAGGPYASFSGYISGFPNAFMDRNWGYSIYPSPDELEYEFLDMVKNPAFAKIEATLIAEKGSTKATLNTSTMFAEGEDNANYGVAYAVIEDNVGPYPQTNYPAVYGGDYYGFENETNPVMLTFNDVARYCSHPLPFDNSLPTKTEANTPYEFSTDINLRGVNNLDNYRVVAMVIDRITGRIQNACEVTPTDASGVKAINANEASFRVIGGKGTLTISNEVAANVYATDGRIVARNVNGNVKLPAGMYIVAAGNETAKVIVR